MAAEGKRWAHQQGRREHSFGKHREPTLTQGLEPRRLMGSICDLGARAVRSPELDLAMGTQEVLPFTGRMGLKELVQSPHFKPIEQAA